MIRNAVQFAVVLLTFMLPMAGMQAQGAGSIDGMVVSAGSTSPVPRATVTLETSGGRKIAERIATLDGHFSIPDVAPGEYRVSALQNGFVSSPRGSQVTVASGRNSSVTVALIPDGVISGRVVDWDGIPVVGIQVQAVTFIQDDRGRRVLRASRAAQTNDLGEYRIYWLRPGSYFVTAIPGDYAVPVVAASLQRGGPATPEPQQLVSTYSPSALDAADARRLDIRAGDSVSGADIRLLEVRKARVSGVASVSSSRRSPELRLTPRNPASGIADYIESADRMGAFQFENVIPGAYFLTAEATNADGVSTFGKMSIEVGTRDVENLSVMLSPGFDLRVRLTIEGRPRQGNDPPLVVNLRPVIADTPFPTVERVGNDELTMHHLMLGDYSVTVLSLVNARNPGGSPVNGGLYLRSAQFGGLDVLTSGLHIDGPPSSVLDIVMADGAGSLSGAVLDEQNQPVPGVTVVLVPEPQLRGRRDLYKTAIADSTGKFEATGIAPGQYKVFSWEAAKQGEWQYPDFIESYEDRGQPIRIDGNRRDPISVTLIPSIN